MQRLLTLAAALVISGAMAFAQNPVSQQAPTSGTQAGSNTVNTSPNDNGTTPTAQGAASARPSQRNQALPGRDNPANASTSDAGANGQAVRPGQGNGARAGVNGDANTPSTVDNGNNNGMANDRSGNNMARGRGSNTITNPQTSGTVQWFWIALGIIIALIVIGVLMSRSRANANIDRNDPALRATGDRDDNARREDRIRRVS